ncbi:MAG TPA: hypothetical protein VKX28_02720 [Xanthobacteraceae bacterium]|nr:hypothetical protein [Xanthobacteraceae bacterium]
MSVAVDADRGRLTVRDARYEGASDMVTGRVLGELCRLIVGRPLQEAADHGAIYAVEALPDLTAAVAGIRSPRNAGPAFALAERLLRKVHAAARQQLQIGHRENGWYIRPPADWLAMDEAAQAAAIKPAIADFLALAGFSEENMWVSRIERGTRVTIAFADDVSYAVKPKLMMLLERRLRESTGNPLELFMDEMKDVNKIRRL